MVEVARRRGADSGSNVDHQVIDAERIELDADSVDGVLCQSGYMLMADPGAALSETRRVLRPGGRLALSVWGAPERNPWASIGGRIPVERGHIPPPGPGSRDLQHGEQDRTRRLLERGLHRRPHGGGTNALGRNSPTSTRWVTEVAGAFAMVVRGLSAGERDALRSQLTDAFVPFVADGATSSRASLSCAVAS